MAISRILQPKSTTPINGKEIGKLGRWCSSVSRPNNAANQKRTRLNREQRAITVETFVKKYMETNAGKFPEASDIQKTLGGSFYPLKGILQNLKEKMLVTPDQQNNDFTDSSMTTLKSAGSEDTISTSGYHNGRTEVQEVGSVVQSKCDEPSHSKESNSGKGTPCETGHSSNAELETASTVTLGISCTDAQYRESEMITSATSHPSLGDYMEKTVSEIKQEIKSMICSSSPKMRLGKEGVSFLDCDSGKVYGLYHLFRNKMDHHEAEPRNPQTRHEDTISSMPLTINKDGISNSYQNQNQISSEPPDNFVDASLTLGELTEVRKLSSPVNGGQKLLGSENHSFDKINNQAAEANIKSKREIFMTRSLDLNRPAPDESSNSVAIKSLIDCIKELPSPIIRLKENDQKNERRSVKESQSLINSKNYRKDGQKPLLGGQPIGRKSKKEGSSLYTNSKTEGATMSEGYNCTKSGSNSQFPLLRNKRDTRERFDPLFTGKEFDENKGILKFLLNETEENDIIHAFQDCGEILKVEISCAEDVHIIAYIYFKTKEGLEKALKKTDVKMKRGNVIVLEAAASMGNVTNKIPIPGRIGDPNVPTAIIKNPIRTVMIRRLSREINLRHIGEALAFCGSNISGFFLGSSSSIAYVEFETEDGKERALAKHSIDILGKRLQIFRIDVPRTTVVRISCHDLPTEKINNICQSYGKVRSAQWRCHGIVDVEFKLAEWPNMLNIVNSLNGLEIEGRKLCAQPATVYPPDILSILWSQHEGRIHVKSMVHGLLQKVSKNVVNRVELSDPVDKFYGDDF